MTVETDGASIGGRTLQAEEGCNRRGLLRLDKVQDVDNFTRVSFSQDPNQVPLLIKSCLLSKGDRIQDSRA